MFAIYLNYIVTLAKTLGSKYSGNKYVKYSVNIVVTLAGLAAIAYGLAQQVH